MGYRHIGNLYKNQTILLFKECYAMEKVHGTSANIKYKASNDEVTLFSGGSSHAVFKTLFNKEELLVKFREMQQEHIIIFGEAYGGKCQGMSDSYGKELKFVAFEVKINNYWLSVPNAEEICNNLNIEFIPYEKIPCTIECIDKERDRDSIVGFRRVGKYGIKREGVVLRPLQELVNQDQEAPIRAKHKREEFNETRTSRKVVDPKFQEVLENANDIAREWVTMMRLKHVLDKLPKIENMTAVPMVMKAMLEDIIREGKDEIIDNKLTRKAIQKHTVILLKKYLNNKLKEM